jgi:hypothetical protein
MAEIRKLGCESLTWVLHPSLPCLPAGNHLIAARLLAGPWALPLQQSHLGNREQPRAGRRVSAHGIHHHPTRQGGRGAAACLPGPGQWGAAECRVTPSELLQASPQWAPGGGCPYLRDKEKHETKAPVVKT